MSEKCTKPAEVRKAVDAYNDERNCGEEDERCWEKTAQARELIFGSNHSPGAPKELSAYAETIRLWGSIQGVARDDYPRAAAVLWGNAVRHRVQGLKDRNILTARLSEVVGLEEAVVDGMASAGIRRRHYSWSSKMLHFLLPATMPVYDSIVREYLGTAEGVDAYRAIATRAQACVRALAPYEAEVVGHLEPRTLLRAIDKFYWWEGRRSAAR